MNFNIFKDRVKKAQNLMEREGIDALLVLNLENYLYFTGDFRKQPRLFLPQKGEPSVIIFDSEKKEVEENSWIRNILTYRAMHEMMLGIMQLITSLVKENPRIAIELGFSVPSFLLDRFKMANPNVEVVDAKPVTSTLRKIKDEDEISFIRQACSFADLGMEVAKNIIKEGIKELDVATEIEYQIKKKGAGGISFPTFVNSGYRSLWLHGGATNKKIQKGDLIILDLGPVYNGYCADICRTFALGKPKEDQRKLHSLYVRMQKEIFDFLKPGLKVMDVEETANQVISEGGFGDYYVRGTIHGIGLSFEETPFPTIFPEDVMEEIFANMVLSTGHSVLSVPEIGGVRVEDTVLVKENGNEYLTAFPNELLEVG